MLEAIKNLATKHATVASASADPGEDYYLLQVTGDGLEILSKEETDDWGGLHTHQVQKSFADGSLLIMEIPDHPINTSSL